MRWLAMFGLLVAMGWMAHSIIGGDLGSPVEAARNVGGGLRTLVVEAGERSADGSGGARLPDEAETASDGPGSTFYQYTDDQGRTHFVKSAGDVPGRYRKSAGTLDVRSEIIRPDQREEPAARRRAFVPEPTARPRATAHASAEVVVYTTTWCGWCRKTMAWLDEQGVDYENRDIESDPAYRRELIAKTGATSIPVVEIDGQVIRGYSPGRMSQLLEI